MAKILKHEKLFFDIKIEMECLRAFAESNCS